MVTKKSSVWHPGYPPTTAPKEFLDEGPIRDIHDSIPIALFGTGSWLIPPYLWSRGAADAPDYWRKLGTGVAVARETTIVKMPGLGGVQQSAKVTADAGDIGALEQRFLQSASFGRFGFLKGMEFAVAVWVKTSEAGTVKLFVQDGQNTAESDPHTGSGTGGVDGDGWELLQAVLTIDSPTAGATELKCKVEGPASAVFYVDGGLAGLGPIPAAAWQAPPFLERAIPFTYAGALSVGDNTLEHKPHLTKPALAYAWSAIAETGPSGGDLDFQFSRNGTTDMFTGTAPDVTDGNAANSGGGAAGDYVARCLGPLDHIELDVDAVNGAAGVTFALHVLQPQRPFDHLVPFDELD